MEIEKIEIDRLQLKDGDILAIIVREETAQAGIARLSTELQKIFSPMGVKPIIFHGDIELKVVRKESQDHPDITLCH